jgi:hypothetical protein
VSGLTIVIKKPRGRASLIPAGLIGLAVILTWLVLLGPLSVMLPGVDLDAPQTLGDLPLVWEAGGTEARDELARLHGKPIPITSGVVARYQENSHTAMLWVSQSPSAGMAARLNETMTARIAEGTSPFEPIGTIDMEGQTIYLLTDGPSGHAYYQAGRNVVWVTGDSVVFIDVLRDSLEAFGR